MKFIFQFCPSVRKEMVNCSDFGKVLCVLHMWPVICKMCVKYLAASEVKGFEETVCVHKC